ncbi:MAG: 30S ribosomal protein S12 methylthiotransferase RimO [Planctomycetota bacterium]|jgi:ribosomal protein S12 methylthiotransferase
MATIAKKNCRPITVGFVALGCPKNIVDSERMLAQIAQAGLSITADASNADVVVINTCGFIKPAKNEALDAINQAFECKKTGKVKKIIVAGCLPQRLGQDLFDQANGIDAIVSLAYRDNIAEIIKKTLSTDKTRVYLTDPGQMVQDDRTRLLITPNHWAYLRISEGCNHRCSFCTIPAIKGRFRSKPRQLVLAEAAELIQAGVVELNIIAQDTTYYGRDLKIKKGLSSILTELEKLEGLRWIRLMYLYPTQIDDQLIETFETSQKIVHYLDIPVQHINNKILRDMRRPDTAERIYRLIEKLRDAMPDIILRTTVMVGFPGETAQQFNELLEFVKRAEFDALGCFKFYPESGTDAANMPHQVPEKIKKQRLEEIMLTQQKIAFEKNKSRIGSTLTCLLDSIDNKGTGHARFYGQAPHIDSLCIIKNCSARPGSFIKTNVVGTKGYDLCVKQI